MALAVIGAGLGRTGTLSLKLALQQLGLGPCHHMEDVLAAPDVQLPLWTAAAAGRPDWSQAYAGFHSAVDWPTAAFWRELAVTYPEAKFVLTTRSTESWVHSYSQTIQKLLAARDKAPPQKWPFIDMATAVNVKCGIVPTMELQSLGRAFEAHSAAVIAGLPKERLLVYEVRQGWEPLCAFLGKAKPLERFPQTNNQVDFWDRIRGS